MKARIASVLLISCCALATACHSKPRTPSPINYFQIGEKSFDSGDYAAALSAYESYLRQNPAASNQDRVLFRIGVALALPESKVYNPQQSIDTLKRLASSFPRSQYRTQAELILKLVEELSKSQAEFAARETQLQTMTADTGRLKQEVEKLRKELADRDAKMKRLRKELDELKKVDLQKKPG